MQLSIAISEAESNIANMRQLERNVADNLRCREMQRDITRMRNKISEMEQQNAETEVDKYKERAEKLRKANNKWTAEVSISKVELTSSKQRWEERSNKWICSCRNITSN
jgi:chromosome segregation ATPase